MSMYLYIFIYCKYMYEDMHACMYVIIYVYMYQENSAMMSDEQYRTQALLDSL